jgi:predicted oxidoreductase
MQTYALAHTPFVTSRIAYGCMKLGATWDHTPMDAAAERAAHAAVEAALTAGMTLFDHADIYCCGKSEEVFGRVLAASPDLRARLLIQTKCGIRFPGDMLRSEPPARYDFSAEHIILSAEDSLRRLGVDTIDILLLHRPDPLVEPTEVARAFDALHASGKVRHFGVSNHSAAQIELLRRHLRQPLVVNQLEFNLAQPALVAEGVVINQRGAATHSAFAEGLLDYCRLHDIRVQAWGPLGAGRITEGPLADAIKATAQRHAVPTEAIWLAWLLRHPAGIQPVMGSINPARIHAAAQADGVKLSREEWYVLIAAARGGPVT